MSKKKKDFLMSTQVIKTDNKEKNKIVTNFEKHNPRYYVSFTNTENACNFEKNENFFSANIEQSKQSEYDDPNLYRWCDEQDSIQLIDLKSWFKEKKIDSKIIEEYYQRFELFDIHYLKDKNWLDSPCINDLYTNNNNNEKFHVINLYDILFLGLEKKYLRFPTNKNILLALMYIAGKPANLHILYNKDIQKHFRLSDRDATWLKKNQIPILNYHLFGPRIFQGLKRNKKNPNIWDMI
jgi:hypothetical protein